MEEINKQIISKILDALRADSVYDFRTLVSSNQSILSLRFGRFPLLSLAYLYRAKKIAREYESRLLRISDYIKVDESHNSYKKFRDYAGVHLCKYGADSIVLPVEMLAIIRETEYLKSKFKTLKPTAGQRENIIKIYSRRGKTVAIKNGALNVSSEPLKKSYIITLASAMAVALLFVFLFPFFIITVHSSIGFGTEQRPFLITNAEQLLSASEREYYYFALNADIILPDGFEIETFSARLDGNGHTIYATGNKPFIGNISGQIDNLSLIATADEIAVTEDFAFFAVENTGTIENITVQVTGNAPLFRNQRGYVRNLSLIATADEIAVTEDFAFFAVENTGTIENITVTANVKITVMTGEGESAVFIGVMTARNNGIITDCRIYGNMEVIITDGTSGALSSFSAHNRGTIRSSHNYADLSLEILNPVNNTDLLVGGITAFNEGILHQNKNEGKLTGQSVGGVIYIGGITAYAAHFNGVVENNGSFGNISGFSSGDAGLFLGGIAGWGDRGAVRNNFSLSVITGTNDRTEGITAVGGIFGSAYGRRSVVEVEGNEDRVYWLHFIIVSNNYFALWQEADIGIGLLFVSNPEQHNFYPGGNITNGTIPASGQSIRNLSIFWE